jgi:beta-xylosidase
VLQQGSTGINGPHQGAWVDTGTGEDWFLHFQDRGWLGRVVHLEPLKWVDDWPEIGDMTQGPIGQPVPAYKKPRTLHASAQENPVDSDEFNDVIVGLQWQWQADPEPMWAFPSRALGALRLIATPAPSQPHNLWDTPAVLLQKLPAPRFIATAKIKAILLNQGDRAGLVLLGKDYGSIVLTKTEHGKAIRQMLCMSADLGTSERTAAEVPLLQDDVYLRVAVDEGKVSFSYSLDGKEFSSLGQPFMAQPGTWIGAKMGIFASGVTDRGELGYADFDWFRLTALP